jgi:hypothetical protein
VIHRRERCRYRWRAGAGAKRVGGRGRASSTGGMPGMGEAYLGRRRARAEAPPRASRLGRNPHREASGPLPRALRILGLWRRLIKARRSLPARGDGQMMVKRWSNDGQKDSESFCDLDAALSGRSRAAPMPPLFFSEPSVAATMPLRVRSFQQGGARRIRTWFRRDHAIRREPEADQVCSLLRPAFMKISDVIEAAESGWSRAGDSD